MTQEAVFKALVILTIAAHDPMGACIALFAYMTVEMSLEAVRHQGGDDR